MHDLAALIRAENTSLNVELGGRLMRIEHRCDTTARELAAMTELAERAVVQSATAQNTAVGAASTAGEALRLTNLQASATDDPQRRMAALELRGLAAAGAGQDEALRHLRRVLVLTGFPRDSKRSEILDATDELFARLWVPHEETYTNFRQTSPSNAASAEAAAAAPILKAVWILRGRGLVANAESLAGRCTMQRGGPGRAPPGAHRFDGAGRLGCAHAASGMGRGDVGGVPLNLTSR